MRHKIGNAGRKLRRLALALYDRVRAIEPGYAQKLFNRGNALANARRFGEALAYYERSLTIRPDDVDALYNSSVMLRRLTTFGRRACAYRSRARTQTRFCSGAHEPRQNSANAIGY